MRWLPLISLFTLAAMSTSACGEAEPEAPPVEPVLEAPAEEPEVVDEPVEAPVPVTPTAHDVLLLVLSDEPLLPSEERLLGVLQERLERRRRFDVERRAVTDEEAALARLFLDPESSPADRAAASLPATFGAASRIAILRVAPPRTLPNGDRATRGFSGAVLFRPPSTEPAFVAQIDEESSWRLTDDRWSSWLQGLLRESEGS